MIPPISVARVASVATRGSRKNEQLCPLKIQPCFQVSIPVDGNLRSAYCSHPIRRYGSLQLADFASHTNFCTDRIAAFLTSGK